MTSEVFSIFGSSNATSTSGTCSGTVTTGYLNLTSEIWTDCSGLATWVSGSAPNTIRVPKGTALKIWESKIAVNGGAGSVNMQMSTDSGLSYRIVGLDAHTENSGFSVKSIRRSGRPLVIQSPEGDTLVRFQFVADVPVPGGIFAEYNAEIVELDQ